VFWVKLNPDLPMQMGGPLQLGIGLEMPKIGAWATSVPLFPLSLSGISWSELAAVFRPKFHLPLIIHKLVHNWQVDIARTGFS
jgi:hypothetical protein